MGTEVNEPVSVGVVCSPWVVRPVWFIWQRRKYPVQEITMRWQTREGRDTILHLSVTDGASLFELALNQSTLIWRLLSADSDGCE